MTSPLRDRDPRKDMPADDEVEGHSVKAHVHGDEAAEPVASDSSKDDVSGDAG